MCACFVPFGLWPLKTKQHTQNINLKRKENESIVECPFSFYPSKAPRDLPS